MEPDITDKNKTTNVLETIANSTFPSYLKMFLVNQRRPGEFRHFIKKYYGTKVRHGVSMICTVFLVMPNIILISSSLFYPTYTREHCHISVTVSAVPKDET